MTCGRVSSLSTQSTFEDLAVDFEGTTASGAERFYRRTLDKLRLKLLESGVIHTVTLKQTERRKKNKKIAAAVYLYQADNDGEWGELRFDFENGTAEIVRLADWDTVKSNIFAKTAIRFVQRLPEARLLKSVVVPFEIGDFGKTSPSGEHGKSNEDQSRTQFLCGRRSAGKRVKRLPLLSINIWWTTTASGASCGLTSRTAQPRS